MWAILCGMRGYKAMKRLREDGPEGFFKQANPRSPHVLTAEVKKVQRYLDRGTNPTEVAKKLKLKANTIRKAIQAGRLYKKK